MALVRQQKLLSFTAGLAVAAASYVSTQKFIWRSAANLADASPNSPTHAERQPVTEPLFGEREKAYMIRKWNQGVDGLFGPIVEGLSKRGL